MTDTGPDRRVMWAVCLLTLVASFVTPSWVEAARPSEQDTARLRAQVKQLRAQTRELRRDLRRERASAVMVASRAADLERSLSQRTTERDEALKRAATLKAKLDAIPSAVDRAVEQVRREVVYSERVLDRSHVALSREALIAHATMNYVVGHVSAPGYGYMNEIQGTRPVATAEGVLQAGSGICGHAALTYAAIVKRFGLPVRSVQFFYGEGDNHIAAEVFYGGTWHYYDPTFGVLYTDGGQVLSIQEARAHPNPQSVLKSHGTLFWYSVASAAGLESLTNLGVETDPDTRVEIDQQPFVG